MSDELSVGHDFKRIASINVRFGDPTDHLMRCAQSWIVQDVTTCVAFNQR